MSKFPKAYKEILLDKNAEKIEYNMSVNYVSKLTAVFGLKEFITNFHDANKMNFKIEYQNGIVVLEDDNTGIPIKYMVIGNSGSRDNEEATGKYGEGTKVGALTFARLGYKVLIETVGYTIAFAIEESKFSNSTVLYAKYKTNTKKKGTTLYVECTKQTFEKAKGMFLFLSDHKKITKNIIEMEGTQKNIYIQGLSHTSKKALFAYDISDKELSTNRDRDFIPMNKLKDQLVQIYNHLTDEEAIKLIMNRFMECTSEFDKMLESKIVYDLDFNDSRKRMFRNGLNPNHYYCLKGGIISLNDKQKKVIEVDSKLFQFLTYIKANTIHENGDMSEDKEGTLNVFKFDKKLLPPTFEAESGLLKILISQCSIKKDEVIFAAKSGYYSDFFPSSDFEDYLIQFKSGTKVFSQRSYDEPFKPILNNLLLLSCFDFEISIHYNGHLYRLEKEIVNDAISVYIHKSESSIKQNFVSVKKKMNFTNGIKEGKKNYIYVGSLKYEKINSLFSYQITSFYEHGYYNIRLLVEKIIQEAINKTAKSFFEPYLSHIKDNLYEHKLNLNLNSKSKKVFKDLFDNLYPNHVIKSNNPTYDSVVSDNYGYELLELPNYQCEKIFTQDAGIKKSAEVFIEKQKEKIHIIPSSSELVEAIILFEKMTGDKADIYLTPILPNNAESINRSGKIYISDAGSKMPIYLAGLIAYEHSQLEYKYKKISQDMQSHLTHYILN